MVSIIECVNLAEKHQENIAAMLSGGRGGGGERGGERNGFYSPRVWLCKGMFVISMFLNL